ncbi:TetR/AcrR family transcriptional regulator [Phenylobacterium sp.]|jgi:AcrR family transcriptional regulator|uniref:TetR/AcrR family transcriptional regulator n=1 Tax=Phenylobacterium sp. TaxID=1871053 RepID=UPI002E33BB1A|nr:TetR/AcrR family transcriptional regulator [Phenylobacterium sp.]HEX2561692.1 TetR/AcrR family transcriptional regulator [Phenylobacterium sp.]
MPTDVATKTVPPVQSEPRSKGERTRERLLDLTYEAVIRKGFAATSIEELVEAAGITKSGFFYHFKDKNDLARQLFERYAANNRGYLDDLTERARALSDDPLHSFLIFLKLYADDMRDHLTNMPGCFIAAVTSQNQSFDRDVVRMNAEGILAWRGRFQAWLEEIAKAYPPKREVDLTAMADAVLTLSSGGVTFAKALQDSDCVARQLLLYRESVRLIFAR